MCRAVLRPALAALAPDQLGRLELHQLRRAALTASRTTSACSSSNHLPDDLLDRHPVGTGHAAPPFVEP
jgi:hypothetical protein